MAWSMEENLGMFFSWSTMTSANGPVRKPERISLVLFSIWKKEFLFYISVCANAYKSTVHAGESQY